MFKYNSHSSIKSHRLHNKYTTYTYIRLIPTYRWDRLSSFIHLRVYTQRLPRPDINIALWSLCVKIQKFYYNAFNTLIPTYHVLDTFRVYESSCTLFVVCTYVYACFKRVIVLPNLSFYYSHSLENQQLCTTNEISIYALSDFRPLLLYF